jgi:alpha-beta hydrolase superfamily lysophospholipase
MPITEITFAGGLPGFVAEAERPQAALLIVHGLAEYALRYASLAEELTGRGITCFAFDQRGHGDAVGPRTHISSFQNYIEDLLRIVVQQRERDPQLPLYLWGHSMGAMVVAAAAAASPRHVRGVILSSNSLEVFRRGPNPLHPVLRALARVVPRVRIPLGLAGEKISSDVTVQRAYVSDPRIPHTASLRLLVEFAAACEGIRTSAADIRVPCLVLHGELDAIAPVAGAQLLFAALGSADKKLVIFPGQRHEVHNESAPVRAQFIATLSEWMLART